MVLIRQVEHFSGTKLTEASANVFKRSRLKLKGFD